MEMKLQWFGGRGSGGGKGGSAGGGKVLSSKQIEATSNKLWDPDNVPIGTKVEIEDITEGAAFKATITRTGDDVYQLKSTRGNETFDQEAFEDFIGGFQEDGVKLTKFKVSKPKK